MELVVDANILFAALIGRDKTYKLFFEDRIRLLAPLKLVSEFENNKEIIAERGKVSVEDLILAFSVLRDKIDISTTDNIPLGIRERAEKLAPHKKDIPYFDK